MSKDLTSRELEVLYLIAGGYSNTEIAGMLYLSPHTIKVLVTCILRKLNSRNRAQAVFVAANTGLLQDKILYVQGIKQKI